MGREHLLYSHFNSSIVRERINNRITMLFNLVTNIRYAIHSTCTVFCGIQNICKCVSLYSPLQSESALVMGENKYSIRNSNFDLWSTLCSIHCTKFGRRLSFLINFYALSFFPQSSPVLHSNSLFFPLYSFIPVRF